jgi:hypothetical protein
VIIVGISTLLSVSLSMCHMPGGASAGAHFKQSLHVRTLRSRLAYQGCVSFVGSGRRPMPSPRASRFRGSPSPRLGVRKPPHGRFRRGPARWALIDQIADSELRLCHLDKILNDTVISIRKEREHKQYLESLLRGRLSVRSDICNSRQRLLQRVKCIKVVRSCGVGTQPTGVRR